MHLRITIYTYGRRSDAQVKHTLKGDTLTVWLEGELDHHTAKDAKETLSMLIASAKVKRLILDLKTLSFMDSSGIGVVLGRYKELVKRGGSVAVRHPCERIDRIFGMSGLYQIVEKL